MEKILIIVDSLSVGGAERQVVSDAHILLENGHDVTIIYYQAGKLLAQLNKRASTLQLGSSNVLYAGFQIFKHLNRIKYDVVFSHMGWALKASALPCYLTRHKLVFFEHGLSLWRRWYHILLIRILELFVSAVVVVSKKKMEIKIFKEHTPNQKLFLIPNSFRMHEFSLTNHQYNDRPIIKIVFVGRFSNVKQLHLLPPIASRLNRLVNMPFKFILCGDGEESNIIHKCINEYNVINLFEFTGYVSNPFSVLQQCDIFVLTSRTEDFSVALVEAGFSGLPLVAFSVGGNSDIIADGINGFLIKPFDIDEFAYKLSLLVNDSKVRKEFGHNAHCYIKDNFTESHRINRIKTLLNKMLND